jgi:hypothetical protein
MVKRLFSGSKMSMKGVENKGGFMENATFVASN